MCHNNHVGKVTSVSRNENNKCHKRKIKLCGTLSTTRSNALMVCQFWKIPPYAFRKENKGSRQSL